jgi:hypothetical protein
MSNEKTVYVVTTGEYSDYGIDAIFDNEPDAKEFARVKAGHVTPWVLNKAPQCPRGKLRYGMMFDANGNVEEGPNHETYDLQRGPSVKDWHDGTLEIRVWARDHNHAIKIAADVRRKHLALKPKDGPNASS